MLGNYVIISLCVFCVTVHSTPLAELLKRHKRFLVITPTTYPTPVLTPTTYPTPPILSSNPLGVAKVTGVTGRPSILGSTSITCPVKRDASVRRVVADTQLLQDLFLSLGGTLDKRYVAVDADEADKEFIDMLLEPTTNTRNQTDDIYLVSKNTVRRDLDKIKDAYEKLLLNSTTKSLTTLLLQNSSTRDRLDRLGKYKNMTLDELPRHLRVESNIGGLSQLEARTNRVQRHKRADGNVHSVEEYCLPRGSMTPEGYMHMCSTCALTSTLSADRFPRLINEAACDTTDCDCFTVAGTAHGKCQQKVFNMKMMRRKVGGCHMIISTGQTLIIDDWELYNQPIKIGCECVIDKRSVFASYIGRT